MVKQLYRGFILPLMDIALRRVTFYKCIESILDTSVAWNFLEHTSWRDIRDLVRSKVLKLIETYSISELLKKQIMHLVNPIGSDITHWIYFHKMRCVNADFNMHNVRHLRLTWSCSIDYQKTAEELVQSEILDLENRFQFACLYCLEEKILILWKEVLKLKETWCDKNFNSRFRDTEMLEYWHHILREEGPNLEQMSKRKSSYGLLSHQHYFISSAKKGNKAATQYFFQQFNGNKQDFLLQASRAVINEMSRGQLESPGYSVVLWYLLSNMNPEQQMQVFESTPYPVLSCLEWSCQDFFLDIAGLYWSFFPEFDCHAFLYQIQGKIKRLGYYFPELFQGIFLCSPSTFRKAFVDQEYSSGIFFEEIFNAEDIESLQDIFRNIEAADRVRLVFSGFIFNLLDDFILRSKWNIVEVFIREASLSKEDRKRLKADFIEYVTITDIFLGKSEETGTHKRRRFFEFLEEMDSCTGEERSAENETVLQA